MDNLKGNTTTIIKWISMYIAGWFIGFCVSKGLQFPVDTETLACVIAGLIWLGIGYIDSKYPNTFKFLDNHITPPPEINQILNDEYECDNNDGC